MERNTALMIAGPVLSLAATLINMRYNKRNVKRWMEARRIDAKPEKNKMDKICGVCGDKMNLRARHTGKEKGVVYWVCNSYPDCRKVEKCN